MNCGPTLFNKQGKIRNDTVGHGPCKKARSYIKGDFMRPWMRPWFIMVFDLLGSITGSRWDMTKHPLSEFALFDLPLICRDISTRAIVESGLEKKKNGKRQERNIATI
jgi:hypothetical protein